MAAILGEDKFAYDCFGDVVNASSRMCSLAEPNAIQVTQMTYEKLKKGFLFESRGQIQVKGKGLMYAYNLLGKL